MALHNFLNRFFHLFTSVSNFSLRFSTLFSNIVTKSFNLPISSFCSLIISFLFNNSLLFLKVLFSFVSLFILISLLVLSIDKIMILRCKPFVYLIILKTSSSLYPRIFLLVGFSNSSLSLFSMFLSPFLEFSIIFKVFSFSWFNSSNSAFFSAIS